MVAGRAAREVVKNPPEVLPPTVDYYSNAVRATGEMIFVAGQVGWDENGEFTGDGGIEEQTRQTLRNIQALLRAANAELSDLVKVTVFVTDISMAPQIARVRSEFFPADGPASTMVEVSSLIYDEFLIEIEAMAVVGSGEH